MEYKYLGKTGLKVSSLCFGTMSFAGDADEKISGEMFHYCREQGINFFDSANVYQDGKSEEVLGKLICDCRQEVVVTSKVYFPTGQDVNAGGASRKHILNAVEDSLRRLKTDYIDIYYIHRFDDYTPLEETISVLDDLIRQGKVLYAGASNFSAWQTVKALGISSSCIKHRFECIQPMYNLVKRQAEVEILPMALSEGLGVIPYSPLGGGLLTGKYGKSKNPGSGRLIDNKIYKIRYGSEWMLETAERFSAFARENGFDPVSLAVAWVSSHPAVTAPIIGARNIRQLKPSIESVKIVMTEELRQEISSLSPEPSPATDRNEEGTKINYGVRK
ncbi:MAG: aldo/keto reductase [Candidatus Aminicenantes bacterium]|nr:aldo/keto reductase [Candidatus Aminicenantes bacterium]